MDEKQITWKRQAVLFLIGQCITLFGSTLVQMAIVWYVTIQTSSGVWVAAFTICAYLPQFLISFVAGVWADRHSRKKLIIGADSLIALVTFLMVLAIPHIADKAIVLYCLLAMSVIRSFGAGIQTPAVNAVIPQLVPEDQIMRFNGINATAQSVIQFAAPAAAGALLTINTLSSTLLIDVATAIVGIGFLSAVMIPKQAIQSTEASVWKDMKIGMKYTLSDKLIGKVLTVYGLFIFLCVPAGFLSQLFVSRVYGETYWYLTAVELAGFIGMVAGGLLMSIWGGFKSRVTTICAGLIVFGSLAIGMGLSKRFALYLTLMIIYGVAITMVQTATTTLIQEKAETSMQGRIFGLLGAMYSGFLPVGMAIFGPMADEIPLQWIMVGSGVALIVLSIFVCTNKELRLNQRPPARQR
ncbi:MAG: MFS transporter [Clostridiales bacterium]|nr:MFS transporter [Clostridiales bacterium]